MRRSDLVPDCVSCAAVCCSALPFDACDDFAFAKPADARCPNVTADHRCAIHGELRARGFGGCAQYGCYGAGQRVTRAFGASLAREPSRNAAFRVLRSLHELIWLLSEARELCALAHAELARRIDARVRCLCAAARDPAALPSGWALRDHERAAHGLLREVGEAVGGRQGARRRSLPITR